MTRSRTTKSTIRARMAKTGERYTAARRHVFAATAPATPLSTPSVVEPRVTRTPVTVEARGVVSEAKVIERTGHSLAHWYGVLDRFGAMEKGHTAAARHLRVDHGLDGWYSQGVTVAYERACGLRAVNQRIGGGYEVSVSKMLDLEIVQVRALFEAIRVNAGWTRGLEPTVVRALVRGIRGAGATGFVPRSRASFHCRLRWDGVPVEIMLSPRPSNRTQLILVSTKLPSREALDAHRATWRAVTTALATSANRPSGARARPRPRRRAATGV
jgi:hypothetical protein